MSHSYQRKGITLIELMVVLTIATILTLVSIPVFTGLVERYRLIGAAEELYASLQYARTEAVKRNTSVYVSFVTGDTWCYGINTGSACDCTNPTSCNLGVKSAPDPQQLTLSATGLSSGSIFFNSIHGGSASGSATITYNIYGGSSLITASINRLGSIQLCATGISGYQAC